MNRREALSATALLLGGTIIGAKSLLSCTPREAKQFTFDPDEINFLDEIAETILPATPDSPGAKEAKLGEFIKIMVTDCYEPANQKIFTEGVQTINERSNKEHGNDFVKLSSDQKHALLVSLDHEAKKYQAEKKEDQPAHYFTLIKQLTIYGYFTSQPGATKALRYVPVPGRYDGCIPYKKGEKAWA